MYCTIATVVAVLYVVWEVNFHVYIALTLAFARLFKKKVGLKDVTTLYGFGTIKDVNICDNHMDNARYTRELDYARFYFYDRTGICANLKAANGTTIQCASTIRYIRSMSIFTMHKLETKLVYWHDRSLFFEQKFITFDGFESAVVMSRQVLVNTDVETVLKNIPGACEKPECPKEIIHWLDVRDIPRSTLRTCD